MPQTVRLPTAVKLTGPVVITTNDDISLPSAHELTGWGLLAALCLKNVGWLISFSLHAVVAAALWEIHIHQPAQSPIFPMFAAFGTAPEIAEPFDLIPMVEIPQTEVTSTDTPSFSDVMMSLSDSSPSGAIDLGPVPTGAGEGTGQNGRGGTGGGKASVGFFGTEGHGGSCVFVVDMSGSMEERGRFARTKQELVRSIAKMKEPQKYYVVFFNNFAIPMFHPRPATEMVDATPGMRAKVTRWIARMRPGSFTNPVPALQIALALEPDVIFLLTDGEIPPETVEIVRMLNQKPTVIHTIAFHSRAGEEILRAIAESSGGEYRYVR